MNLTDYKTYDMELEQPQPESSVMDNNKLQACADVVTNRIVQTLNNLDLEVLPKAEKYIRLGVTKAFETNAAKIDNAHGVIFHD